MTLGRSATPQPPGPHGVNTVTARTNRVDVDALLIRPDGCVAWALRTGQDLDATALVGALGTWFGHPA
ncbi:aromatic-ring hydroxylase C-terminal domain-containing protein [Micromonospora sp. NBC_01813]|uniref:aromatic-ring hydroxylase C-terminal domain-containing protein n=1 Tax=Micromonospora sp. NBC_01813 TaxID=2975988 RepID=UPI002DD810DB|nr:hypothetical protein [Micromonospora sp. NBC_01813]WSA07107.1 hypothetical protein OG958_22980 [Micromonospora sp. NBC_01813]